MLCGGFDLLSYAILVNDKASFNIVYSYFEKNPDLLNISKKTIFLAIQLETDTGNSLLREANFVINCSFFKYD